jgi:hypothetical protein
MVARLRERTGSLATATLVMAALAIVTFLCALAFPDRSGGTATRALGRCSGRRIDLGSFAGCDFGSCLIGTLAKPRESRCHRFEFPYLGALLALA